MSKVRVLLCGTVFGSIYLDGIKNLDNWELCGILSRGSDRSVKISQEMGVPLYKEVCDVPEGMFDVAFVVIRSGIVGGEGQKISEKLLDKHINVVQEQPVHADEAAVLLKSALKNNVSYIVNTFYPYMESSTAFHEKLSEIRENNQIISIDGCCSLPVLLPFIDQIGRTAGLLRPWSIENVFSNGACDFVTGKISGIPFSIRIQGRKSESKNQAFVLNQINVMTSSGNLIMTDVNDQVIWMKKTYVVEEFIKNGREDDEKDVYASEMIYDAGPKKYSFLYKNIWPKAVENFLIQNKELILSRESDIGYMQYYLSVCSFWKELYKKLEELD